MHDMHHGRTDLNLLLVLEALLAERSVTRAAERLNLSQPAVSHALKRLRLMFHDQLLVRGKGGMMPTALAAQLAVPLQRGLVELERVLRREVGFDPKTSQRGFTLATVDYPQLFGLPQFVRRLTREAPGIDLQVVPLGTGLAEALESGALDLVLAGGEVERVLALDRGLMRSKIISEPFVCVVRRNHPGVKDRLDLKTFAALPHLLVSTSGKGKGMVDQALEARGLSRRIAVRLPHFVGAPFVVAQSDLIATLPKTLAEQGARLLGLRLFEPPLKLPRGDAYLWWHARLQDDPAHAWFRRALLDVYAAHR